MKRSKRPAEGDVRVANAWRAFEKAIQEIRSEETGAAMMALATRLFPICRSITGEGVRQTLEILGETVALNVQSAPTGYQAFDWTVPREWNIRDAYVKNERGQRVIDLRDCNLHVINYSSPVRAWMSLEELRPHLHARPELPDAIPYLTTYYEERWGFCLSWNDLQSNYGGGLVQFYSEESAQGKGQPRVWRILLATFTGGVPADRRAIDFVG